MEKNIYDLLNDVQSKATEAEKVDFTQLEAKRLKKSIKTQLNGGHKMKKSKLVAGFLLVGMALVTLPFGQELYAGVQSVTYDLAGYLGIEKDLADYTTVIHQSQSDNGITVTLNEVILDQGDLIVATTEQYAQNAEHATFLPPTVRVNGQIKQMGGSSGSSKQIDDYTNETVMTYHLGDLDINQDLAIDIHFKEAIIDDRRQKGTWRFAFQTNGQEIAADTTIIPLGNQITLPNDQLLTLDYLSSNALGQKIQFTLSTPGITYLVELRGHDQLNNPVTFSVRTVAGQQGKFTLETAFNGSLSDEAQTLTLTPYATKISESSGRANSDYVPVGEAFVIELNQ